MTGTNRTIASRPPLDREQIADLLRRLLDERRELLALHDDAEADLRAIEEERESEWAELAQEEAAALRISRLDDREKQELDQIDRALERIAWGTYGRCHGCGGAVSLERLRALPETRLCVDCERTAEAAPPPPRAEVEARRAALPAELRDLGDAELAELVRDRLRDEGGDDFREVRVRCRHAVVYLSGEVPSETLRQDAVETVSDWLGLGVVDRLRISELPWERDPSGPRPLTAEEIHEMGYSGGLSGATPRPDDEERIDPAPLRPGLHERED